MDARSAEQTNEILEKGAGDPALAVNCDGEGPLSAEWMLPKSLWLKQNEPDTFDAAATIAEAQDYINFKLVRGAASRVQPARAHASPAADLYRPRSQPAQMHFTNRHNAITYNTTMQQPAQTGRMVCSTCSVATRWHWDAAAALAHDTKGLPPGPGDGRPRSLLARIGLESLLHKWPSKVGNRNFTCQIHDFTITI